MLEIGKEVGVDLISVVIAEDGAVGKTVELQLPVEDEVGAALISVAFAKDCAVGKTVDVQFQSLFEG